MSAPADIKESLEKPARVPASDSKDTLRPKETSFFTVSGEAATRFSPGDVSCGIKKLGKINESIDQLENTR